MIHLAVALMLLGEGDGRDHEGSAEEEEAEGVHWSVERGIGAWR